MIHWPLTTNARNALTWMALGLYSLTRIGLLAIGRIIALTVPPTWIHSVYQLGAYLLAAFLLWLNLPMLARYHIDRLAVLMFILGLPLNTLLTRLNLPFPASPSTDLSLFYVPIAAIVLVLAIKRG